jgi:2-succinyl-5-enolpyruvyl-6-hydroxy-3-cyclohexene-1-carboxylate synthase
MSGAATAENLLAVWAELLFDGFAAAGVTDVVISPGSRSTPFVLAALADQRLRCHDVVDERSAAFFALGQARASGRPSVLLCTSGTAGAHYLPAVIEAAYANVPLIAVTADRPPELHHAGANQTVAQAPLFAGYARHVVDLGAPEPSRAALWGQRRAAVQAVARALAPVPGPVHVNAPARKPLEPRPPTSAAGHELAATAQALRARPVTRVAPARITADPALVAEAAALCLRHRRGLIVAGPAPASLASARAAVDALARASGFPVYAETPSQLRLRRGSGGERVDGLDWLLSSPAGRRALAPELVIQLGAPPTSPSFERLVDERPELERIVLSPSGWPDPHGSATILIHGEIAASVGALAAALAEGRGDGPTEPTAYARALAAADAMAWRIVDADLAAGEDTLEEGAVARLVLAALAPGQLLVIGNSLPIRTVDLWCPGGSVDVTVLSQRGASGIDGLVAGAAGSASVDAARPTTLLVGDVSFVHDLGGLLLARRATAPLVIVVVNNDGGRIFEQLPLGDHADPATLDHFVTPPRLDLGAAARAFGVAQVTVTGRGALAAALAGAHTQRRCTVIEAVVPPHGAARSRRRVGERISQALEP